MIPAELGSPKFPILIRFEKPTRRSAGLVEVFQQHVGLGDRILRAGVSVMAFIDAVNYRIHFVLSGLAISRTSDGYLMHKVADKPVGTNEMH